MDAVSEPKTNRHIRQDALDAIAFMTARFRADESMSRDEFHATHQALATFYSQAIASFLSRRTVGPKGDHS